MSAHILNQVYLSKYRGDIASFRLYVMTTYAEHSSSPEKMKDAFLVAHLVNYMYLSCKIGVV